MEDGRKKRKPRKSGIIVTTAIKGNPGAVMKVKNGAKDIPPEKYNCKNKALHTQHSGTRNALSEIYLLVVSYEYLMKLAY